MIITSAFAKTYSLTNLSICVIFVIIRIKGLAKKIYISRHPGCHISWKRSKTTDLEYVPPDPNKKIFVYSLFVFAQLWQLMGRQDSVTSPCSHFNALYEDFSDRVLFILIKFKFRFKCKIILITKTDYFLLSSIVSIVKGLFWKYFFMNNIQKTYCKLVLEQHFIYIFRSENLCHFWIANFWVSSILSESEHRKRP